jgi:hypothetical protein
MSTPKSGRVVGQNRLLLVERNHPLLTYATHFWAYHVSKCAANSQELIIVLKTFFAKYVLSWIEAVALSGNLRHLTRSAQYLKAYSKKTSRASNLDANDNLLSLREPPPDDKKRIQPWANDFIRIVGKFGRNLIQSPSCKPNFILIKTS